MKWQNKIKLFSQLGFKSQALAVYEQLRGPGIGPQDGSDCGDLPCVVKRPENPRKPDVNPEPRPDHVQRYVWCLDAGHGWQTLGKRSPVLPSGQQLIEYEFNRDVVERIIEMLVAAGVAFMRTMPQHGEYDNALRERVGNANNYPSTLPKLFVSVHGNAGPARSPRHYTLDEVRGLETWHKTGSTAGEKMARIFQAKLVRRVGSRDRGVKSKPRGEFYVLRATRMPAVLTENLFYNNRFDLAEMLNPAVRQLIAEAHVDAILEIESNGL